MGWQDINLKDVNPQFETIPEKRYAFKLLGARWSERMPGKIEVTAAIVDEGDFQNRRVFFGYSDPDVWAPSPKALKRLEQSIGIDSLDKEDPIGYLNRAAQMGARFSAEIKHRTYQNTDSGEDVTVADLQLFSVGPAA